MRGTYDSTRRHKTPLTKNKMIYHGILLARVCATRGELAVCDVRSLQPSRHCSPTAGGIRRAGGVAAATPNEKLSGGEEKGSPCGGKRSMPKLTACPTGSSPSSPAAAATPAGAGARSAAGWARRARPRQPGWAATAAAAPFAALLRRRRGLCPPGRRGRA